MLEGGSSKTHPCPEGDLNDQQGRQRWEHVIEIMKDMHNSKGYYSRSVALNILSMKVFSDKIHSKIHKTVTKAELR